MGTARKVDDSPQLKYCIMDADVYRPDGDEQTYSWLRGVSREWNGMAKLVAGCASCWVAKRGESELGFFPASVQILW